MGADPPQIRSETEGILVAEGTRITPGMDHGCAGIIHRYKA